MPYGTGAKATKCLMVEGATIWHLPRKVLGVIQAASGAAYGKPEEGLVGVLYLVVAGHEVPRLNLFQRGLGIQPAEVGGFGAA